MTDQENTADGFASLIQLWIAQRRKITKGLAGMTGLSEPVLSQPVQGLPRPGALSAAQLHSIASGVAAQRRSIAALQAQLAAFDRQLAALERIVGPLAEWSRTWAEFEGLVINARTRARGLLITQICANSRSPSSRVQCPAGSSRSISTTTVPAIRG
jgi:hypothetical protein